MFAFLSTRFAVIRDCFSLVSTIIVVLGFGQDGSFFVFVFEKMFSRGFMVFYEIFNITGTDLRFEITQTDDVWYTHGIFRSGYTYKTDVIGHSLGGDGRSFFSQIDYRLSQKTEFRFSLEAQQRGRSQSIVEDRDIFNLGMKYDMSDQWQLLYNYSYIKIANQAQTISSNDIHLFSVGSSYQF